MFGRPGGVKQHLHDFEAHGDLTVIGQLKYYEAASREFRLVPFAVGNGRLPTVDQARTQPSQLLDARIGVVGFTGRGRELAWLDAWRERTGGSRVSAVLIHGEGGSGKTRLARQFALAADGAEWSVWEAAYDTAGSLTSLPEDLIARSERGLLLLVDYVERWPMDQLLGMVRHPLIAGAGGPVRLMLLARSAGNWWSALAHRLNLADVACDERLLPSLPGGLRSAPRMFAAARDRFSEVLQVPDCAATAVPDLSHRDFELVLGVHMAALVAVDAQLRGDGVPQDPAQLSAYLLRRERDAWRSLPPAGNQRPRSSPEALARTVYTAVLAGPLPYRDAVVTLARTGLAVTPPAAQSLLDDHRLLYPEREQGTFLEPLYPDRLAEDFLALSSPPHNRADSPPDPWAADAPAALLAPAGPDTPDLPPWSRSGMAVLIETARRWEHVRTAQLYPLLREHPELALVAGPAALTSLIELEDLPPGVLDAFEALLPDVPDFEYDLVYAAIAQRAVEHRLSDATDAAERAALRQRLGWRYSVAGLDERALTQYEEAADLFRALADSHPVRYRPKLAGTLERLSYVLAGLGRGDDALAAAEEAVHLRKLGDPSSLDYLPELASAQLGLGYRLAALRRDEEARDVKEEALRGYRQLAENDPSASSHDPSRGLAVAMISLSLSLWLTGQLPAALQLAEEGAGLARRLAEANRNAHLNVLAEALRVLSHITGDTNQSAERLAAAQEAVTLFRLLARANPNAHLRPLANSLVQESRALAGAARFSEALAPAEESVLVWRGLAKTDPEAYRFDLAVALDNYSDRLSDAGRPDDGLAAAQECVGLLRSAPHEDSSLFLIPLAEATATVGRRLAELGQLAAAVAQLQAAIALQRELSESDPSWIPDLAFTLCTLADQQRALGHDAESRTAAEEAISLLRTWAADHDAADSSTMARALTCLARVAALAPDGNAEAVAARQEAVGILRRLKEADPGRNQLDLVTGLFELSEALSAAGRGTEALPLTAEAVPIAQALAQADPDERRLHGLVLALMEYVWIRWESGQQLPEALAALGEAEQLLRLPRSGQPSRFSSVDIGHVLELRAAIFQQLGRHEEALEARRAIQAQKGFDDALEPGAKGIRLVSRLADMAALDQPQGAEALAVRMVAAKEGSSERYAAHIMLKRRLRREKRAGHGRLPAVQAAAGPARGAALAPDAASLLADITALDAVDPKRHISSRREGGQELIKLGDPRGTEILVAQALDTGARYFHREAAAQALIKAGDPRSKYLLTDVLAERAADPRTRWFHRTAAIDQLRALDDPRAEELSARPSSGSAITPAASSEPLWQLAIQANAYAGLTGVSSASLTALSTLSTAKGRPPRSRGYERPTRWLAALLLLAPPALMLLAGVSVTEAPHANAGPGNWIALCVSAYIFYVVAHESMTNAGWFAARTWRMSANTKRYFFFCYVMLMPIAAVIGFLLAHSALGFVQPAGRFFWNILIWR